MLFRSTADLTRGEGDASSIKIFAESYGKDPDFAEFYRSLSAYKEVLKSDKTRMVISPDNEFFRYMNTSSSSRN